MVIQAVLKFNKITRANNAQESLVVAPKVKEPVGKLNGAVKQGTVQKQLTQRIVIEKHPNNLKQILVDEQDLLDPINISTIAVTLGRSLTTGFEGASIDDAMHAYQELLSQIILHLPEMNLQSVVNCIWSLGKAAEFLKIHINNPYFNQVFNLLLVVFLKNKEQLNHQGISNALISIARVGSYDEVVLQEIVIQSMKLDFSKYLPLHISNILWALTKVNFQEVEVLEFFVDCAKEKILQMDGIQIAAMMWALRKQRYFDVQLFDQVEQIIVKNQIVFDSQQLSLIGRAFAEFYDEKNVNQKFIQVMIDQFISSKNRKLIGYVNFIFALSLMNCEKQQIQIVIDLMVSGLQGQFQLFNKDELNLLRRAQQYYLVNKNLEELNFPDQLIDLCQQQRKKRVSWRYYRVDNLSRKVFFAVKKKFPFAQQQISEFNDEIQINIGIVTENVKIAIEPRGESSFTVTEPRKLIRSTAVYVSLLKELGWKVILVSGLKWEDAKYRRYVLKLIKKFLEKQTSCGV